MFRTKKKPNRITSQPASKPLRVAWCGARLDFDHSWLGVAGGGHLDFDRHRCPRPRPHLLK
jgi:hypothetical protein